MDLWQMHRDKPVIDDRRVVIDSSAPNLPLLGRYSPRSRTRTAALRRSGFIAFGIRRIARR
jgi:hypothetical protein